MKNSKNFVIFADGKNEFFNGEGFQALFSDQTVIALDGASEILRKASIIPDVILGDMDSVSRETLKFFAKLGTEILPGPDQNFSDLEKAIFYCKENGARSITITNATSGRFDHTIANIFFLKKYHSFECDMKILDNGAAIMYEEESELVIRAKVGCKCGFFGAPQGKISSYGLKYELDNFELLLGFNESLANEFSRNNVQLKINGQCLLTFELGDRFPLTLHSRSL
ncbi:MAG: thiamine diphosphokinase [Puniceicoccales bacterium]|jgi:thiamine pyrophosphokinase|nr:thiamine diphosphokinase [Puniceicoccales bacterium]